MENFKDKLKSLLEDSESLERRVATLQRTHDELKLKNDVLMKAIGDHAKEVGNLQKKKEQLSDRIAKETADFERYKENEEAALDVKRTELSNLNKKISSNLTLANEQAAENEKQENANREESQRLQKQSAELDEKEADLNTREDGIAYREGNVKAGEANLIKQQEDFEKQKQEQNQEYQKVIEQSKVNEGKLQSANKITADANNLKKELKEKGEFLDGRERELNQQAEANDAAKKENETTAKNLSDKKKNLKVLEAELLLEAAKYKKK